MKISDLLEVDEWNNINTPETLDYLRKKQESACHQFILELQKLIRLNPDISLTNWVTVDLKSMIEWRADLVKGPRLPLGEKYPSLNRLWNRMAKAKEKYEEAGGTYGLLEADEWQNNPVTLTYLYKKQASACHQFINELNKIAKTFPNDKDLQTHSRLIRLSLLLSKPTTQIKSWGWPKNTPSLTIQWKKVLKAKQRYEEAGGTYDDR